MRNSIESLDGHNIVCGFGRIGQRIAEEFKAVGQSVVIIENDPLKLEHMQADGWLGVEGDGGDDNALIDANVKSASRLIAATGSDATNLMISLSARTINPGLFIVARADDAANEQKLLKAGANRVVPIYRSAGRRMVQLAMRPNAVEFTDIALGDHEIELSIEDIRVQSESPLDGATIENCITPEGGSYMIIAIRRKDGALEMMPPPSTPIVANDVLVVFGTRDQFSELESLTSAPG